MASRRPVTETPVKEKNKVVGVIGSESIKFQVED